MKNSEYRDSLQKMKIKMYNTKNNAKRRKINYLLIIKKYNCIKN